MKRNYIFKEAGILLVVATLILTTVAATANTQTTVKVKDPIIESFDTFTEGFEGGVVPPAGWLNIDYDGDGFLWTIIEPPGFPPHSGDYSAGSESWDAVQQVPLTPDNWLITTPMIASGTTELSYWVAAQDPLWAEEHIEVWISTTGTTVPDDFTDQVDDYTCPAGSSDWFERVIDLSSYDGENIYIAFRHCDCTDWFWIKIDDVTVTNVEFGEPLVADADGPYEADEGEPIQFQGDASGGVPPYSFHWDFGNSDTSDEEDPIYTYDDPGVYQVILTVIDDENNTDDDATTATINEIPCCFEYEILPGFGIGLRAEVTEICEENQAGVPWEFKITGGLIVIPISPLSGTADFTAGETKIIKAPLVLGIGNIAITFTIDDCEPREVNALIIGPFVIVR